MSLGHVLLITLKAYDASIQKNGHNKALMHFLIASITHEMAPKHNFNAQEIIEKGRVPQECLDEIHEWLQTQKFPIISDEQAIIFLLSCANDLEATKNTIHNYFQCRADAPELFLNRNVDAEDVVRARKICDYVLVPVRSPKNEIVVVCRLLDTSYYKFQLDAVTKTFFMVAERALYQDPPDGLVVVLDMKGFGLLHLTRLKIGILRKIFHYIQEGIPVSLKSIHVLNTVYFIDKIMKILKPFMKEELYNMIKFHPTSLDMNEFFEHHLPADCIPEDYGGNLTQMNALSTQTYSALRGMENFYRDEEEQVQLYKLQ